MSFDPVLDFVDDRVLKLCGCCQGGKDREKVLLSPGELWCKKCRKAGKVDEPMIFRISSDRSST